MSELIVTALKVLFLALLWIFIFLLGGVIKTDLFGKTVTSSELKAETAKRSRRRAKKGQPRKLVITSGATAGASYPLSGGDLLIGRNSDCRIILDDDYVSTRHARIGDSEEGWYVEDMGSTNGTYVNGQRVVVPTLITAEDVVRIGRTTMKLEP